MQAEVATKSEERGGGNRDPEKFAPAQAHADREKSAKKWITFRYTPLS
jgi:hypothetical protein